MADKYTHRRLPVGWPDETTVCAVVERFSTPGGVRVDDWDSVTCPLCLSCAPHSDKTAIHELASMNGFHRADATCGHRGMLVPPESDHSEVAENVRKVGTHDDMSGLFFLRDSDDDSKVTCQDCLKGEDRQHVTGRMADTEGRPDEWDDLLPF